MPSLIEGNGENEMTPKQKEQFNRMRTGLRKIARKYMTTAQIRKDATKEGLDFEEYLEMSYENIQNEAEFAVRGVKGIS